MGQWTPRPLLISPESYLAIYAWNSRRREKAGLDWEDGAKGPAAKVSLR